MKRRDFITRMTGASLAGLATASLPGATHALAASAPEPPRVLRGAPGGRILESMDGGATWRQAAQFGSELEVAEVRPLGAAFYARLRFGADGEHTFWLTSADGRAWRTCDGPAEA